MLSRIAFTFSSRVFVTGINFLVILLTARFLGAEGRGVISLLILGITINLLFSNVFGGAAISYLTPRVTIHKLVLPSYLWAVFSTTLVTCLLLLIQLVPSGLGMHLFCLSFLQAFYNIHLNVLIGKAQIKQHNLVNMIQVAVLCSLLIFLLLITETPTYLTYVISLYASLFVSFLLTLFLLRSEIQWVPLKEWMGEWKTIFGNGYIIQIASIAQLLNYRFSYYLLDHFTSVPEAGKKLVGVYSTAVAIAEAVWVIGKSLGLVQYSRIVKEQHAGDSISMTLRYGKISFVLSFLLVLPPLLLPPGAYAFIFGPDFERIPGILLLLLPGILSFAIALMFSNYFAGFGMNRINLYGSVYGLAITLILGIAVVPIWGMKGAALTASLSYVGTSLYLFRKFLSMNSLPWRTLIPGIEDVLFLKTEFWKRIRR